MEIREALKSQYRGGLAMMARCIERCPDDLWVAPNPPETVRASEGNPDWNGVTRPFWRIAFHTVYFTHLYLGQNADAFQPPPGTSAVRRRDFAPMWQSPWDLEPYELPTDANPCSRSEVLAYVGFVVGLVDQTVEGLDLDHPQSGFPWYENCTKIAHQLMNLRHLQGHVGQLSELLMLRGIDIDWVSGFRD